MTSRRLYLTWVKVACDLTLEQETALDALISRVLDAETTYVGVVGLGWLPLTT